MKMFLVAAVAFCAQASMAYSNQTVLTTTSSQIKLEDAQYTVIPTHTEVRHIPGCTSGGEANLPCDETVVIASEPAIVANISYIDSQMPHGDGQQENYTAVYFKTSDFSSSDVAALEAVYPLSRHPFTNVPRRFAQAKLALTAETVTQTTQVVDKENSTFCPPNEVGQTPPGCVEHIVYKESKTKVILATVHIK